MHDASGATAPLKRNRVPIVSPLRYPGSKRRLAGYIQRTLELNELCPALFVEPFAGGASVGLQLLSAGAVKSIGLIELDPLVAAFWQTAFFDSDWLIKQVKEIQITIETWKLYKARIPNETRERAIACLFLNRTSFSGILAPGAGPIGGFKQESDYKLDCRFPRERLVQRLEEVAALKDKVSFVLEMSWDDGMGEVCKKLDKDELLTDVFYYFDPPFFEKADRLYTHYFRQSDHQRLKDIVVALSPPWMLSYDSLERVQELYGSEEADSAHVEVIYSTSAVAGNRVAREVILTNLDSLPRETRLWRRSAEWKKGERQLSHPAASDGRQQDNALPEAVLVGQV